MKKIIIIGNLGKDAEARQTAYGKTFYTFSVAVSEKYVNQKNEEVEETTWFECLTSKSKLAQYLKKGKKVYIEGNPKSNLFYSEQQRIYKTNISVACTIIRLLTPNDQARPTPHPPPQKATAATQANPAESVSNEDLPF